MDSDSKLKLKDFKIVDDRKPKFDEFDRVILTGERVLFNATIYLSLCCYSIFYAYTLILSALIFSPVFLIC